MGEEVLVFEERNLGKVKQETADNEEKKKKLEKEIKSLEAKCEELQETVMKQVNQANITKAEDDQRRADLAKDLEKQKEEIVHKERILKAQEEKLKESQKREGEAKERVGKLQKEKQELEKRKEEALADLE